MTVVLPIERSWRQRTSAGAAQQARDVLPPVVAFFGLIAAWEVTVRALNNDRKGTQSRGISAGS